MTRPLPLMFAAYCVEERWFSIAPTDWPGGRTFARMELRAIDREAIGINSDKAA